MPWTYIFIFSPASREPFQVGLWCAYNIKYYLWRNSGMACTFLVLHPLFFTPIFLALFSSLQHPQIILSFLTFQKKKNCYLLLSILFKQSSTFCLVHFPEIFQLRSLLIAVLTLQECFFNQTSADSSQNLPELSKCPWIHSILSLYVTLAKGLQYHPLKHECNGTGNKDLMLVTTLHFLPATVLWAICYCL